MSKRGFKSSTSSSLRRTKPVHLEDLLLERSEAFWRMIERARAGKSVSIEQVRNSLEARAPTRKLGRSRKRT